MDYKKYECGSQFKVIFSNTHTMVGMASSLITHWHKQQASRPERQTANRLLLTVHWVLLLLLLLLQQQIKPSLPDDLSS